MNKGKSWGVMVVVVLGIWEVRMGSAAPSAAECKEERRLGINACQPVLYGKDPSSACCERARVTHLECVCPVITPKVAALIPDINRLVRLVQGCGRNVPRHYKCGSMSFNSLSLSLSYLSRIEIHLLTGFPSLQVLLLHEIKIFERVWFAAYGERYLYIYIYRIECKRLCYRFDRGVLHQTPYNSRRCPRCH